MEDAIELVIRRLRDDLLLEEDAYYTIPEEPFPNRFNDLLDNIYNHSSQAPSWLWASPVCLPLLLFISLLSRVHNHMWMLTDEGLED